MRRSHRVRPPSPFRLGAARGDHLLHVLNMSSAWSHDSFTEYATVSGLCLLGGGKLVTRAQARRGREPGCLDTKLRHAAGFYAMKACWQRASYHEFRGAPCSTDRLRNNPAQHRPLRDSLSSQV